MNAAHLASQIISDLWEYGRLVIILVVAMSAWGFIIGRFEDDRDGAFFFPL